MKTRAIKILLFVSIVCLSSCDKKRVFDSYQTLEAASWNQNKAVEFNFAITDTINTHNLFFSVRNNHEYPFSNLFLISELNFPNGKKIVDTLEYEMADNSGKWLGKGLSNTKESKLFYKENVVFPNQGNYKVSVSQAIRKSGEVNGVNSLKGITDVGFRIEKIN